MVSLLPGFRIYTKKGLSDGILDIPMRWVKAQEYSQVVSEKEIKVEIYRSTFNLFSPLGAEQFPFDRIELPIIIEVIPQAEFQSIVWVESLSGISSNYENLGWNSPEFELTSDHASPFGLTVPRASFVVIQNRKAEVGLITAIAPPLLFCAISASVGRTGRRVTMRSTG